MLQYTCARQGTIQLNYDGGVTLKDWYFKVIASPHDIRPKLSPYIAVGYKDENAVLNIIATC